MTKYEIARRIEEVAHELGRHPCSASRLMAMNYDYFTKAELQQKLSDLEDELKAKKSISNQTLNTII